MSTLAALNIMIGANSAVLRKELTRAKKATGNFVASAKKQLGSLASNSARMGKSMGMGLAAGTATLGVGLVAMEQTLKSIDGIRRQAANVSMPIEQYQAYAFATKAAGLEAENFGDVIKDLNANITDFAVSGGGVLADFFAVTGQDIEQWQRLQPAEQFERFTKELENMSESQARFWLDEINDSASQMFSTLRGNKGEFASNVQLAQDLGLVMSQDVIAGVQATYSEINTLKSLLGGAWQHIVASASPAIKFVTEGLRQWLTDTARVEGGFSSLGRAISLNILSGVQSATVGISSLIYEVQSAAYKLAGEQSGTYIALQRNLRKSTEETEAYSNIVESNRESYEITKRVLSEVESGTRSLSNAQLAQARAFVSQHEESILVLGRMGNNVNALEEQLENFEQKEGISAPFSNAISVINKLKKEIKNTKSVLGAPLDFKSLSPPSYEPQSVVKNPFATEIQQAEDYFALKKLMRDNDWEEEKAQLQLKLNRYAEANLARKIDDEQYRLLSSMVTDEFQQSQLEKNQSFLAQLKEQALQATQDYQTMWGNTFDRFTQGIGQSTASAMMQQQSFKNGLKSVTRSIVSSSIAALTELGVKKLALWAIEKSINKASAASAGGLLTAQAQAMSKMAAIAAFSSTAAIPIVGPPAAPGAMAAALAVTEPMAGAVAGFASGMVGIAHSGIDYVHKEGTWLLDKGERVYTSESVAKLDEMYSLIGALAASERATSNYSYNFTMSVEALDSKGFDTWYQDNRDDILRDVQLRFGEPL